MSPSDLMQIYRDALGADTWTPDDAEEMFMRVDPDKRAELNRLVAEAANERPVRAGLARMYARLGIEVEA